MHRAQEETRRANDFIAKRDYGRVPDYLVERKLELAERERERREKEELAHIPPGMRVLPEDERLRTLEILAENRQDVEESPRCPSPRMARPPCTGGRRSWKRAWLKIKTRSASSGDPPS